MESNKQYAPRKLQGAIAGTETEIKTSSISLTLDAVTAWQLCQLLSKERIEKTPKEVVAPSHHQGLINLGKAIGAYIDHPNGNFTAISQGGNHE